LQKQIQIQRNVIENCKHEFGKAYSNPESYMHPYGSVQDGCGSDPHWSPAGYEERFTPRWTRACTKCGYKEHTYKQKDIVIATEPNFN
jgi:hypothetical protein